MSRKKRSLLGNPPPRVLLFPVTNKPRKRFHRQIIWAMLFHLIRFSMFMLVVMVSFAISFHSLYSHPNCSAGDDLYETFGNLHDSLLVMFEAMLGGGYVALFVADNMSPTITRERDVFSFFFMYWENVNQIKNNPKRTTGHPHADETHSGETLRRFPRGKGSHHVKKPDGTKSSFFVAGRL